jgi:hypothetical protein
MKDTAVEWAINEIRSNWYDYEYGDEDMNELLKQAKEMEKDQIVDAFEHVDFNLDDGLHYYNETFNK